MFILIYGLCRWNFKFWKNLAIQLLISFLPTGHTTLMLIQRRSNVVRPVGLDLNEVSCQLTKKSGNYYPLTSGVTMYMMYKCLLCANIIILF